jgi:hypothetical protein
MVSKPSTRDMSDRHEDFLAELLGGRKTKGSGSHWRDQMDGKNDQHEQSHALVWDGKATQNASVSISRDMWAKACEQSGGLIPSVAIRFYSKGFLLKSELDLITLEANDFAAILEDARKAQIRGLEAASAAGVLRDVQNEERHARHRLAVLLDAEGDLTWDALLDLAEQRLNGAAA